MNIKLRDLQPSDKEYFFSWIKDKDVIRYSLSIFQKMKGNNEISNWFNMLLLDKSSYNKAIVDTTKDKLIGISSLFHVVPPSLVK